MPKPRTSSASDDARFSAMHTASTFNTARKEAHKVKLDGRFEGVLTDSRFRAAPGQVDRYGRKGKGQGKGGASKELQQFYQVEEAAPEPDANKSSAAKAKSKGAAGKNSTEDRMEYINRLSRGEVDGSSSSSDDDSSDAESDSSSSSSEDEEVNELATKKRSVLDIPQAEGEEEDVPTGESARRLALMHCDWDNIKAEDLLVVLQSFCPASGSVKSVSVYPSDFGIERMAREQKFGPQGIWTAAQGEDEDEAGRSSSGSDGSQDSDSAEDEAESEAEDEEAIYENVVGGQEKGADFERTGKVPGLVRDHCVCAALACVLLCQGDEEQTFRIPSLRHYLMR